MSRKPDAYYWRGPGGDGWSRRETAGEQQTGSWHGVGTQGAPEEDDTSFAGVGPRNYQRSDRRIEEEVNERLTCHAAIDATNLEVHVQDGDVTLLGAVRSRPEKHLAEDITIGVSGVKQVNNQIQIDRD